MFVSVCIFVSSACCVFAEDSDVRRQIEKTAAYLMQTVSEPTVSGMGGEWTVLGLARGGAAESEYFEKYYENVCNTVVQNAGILHRKKYTEYSRVILALSAIGKNPQNVCGYNLLVPLGDYRKTIQQGTNGAIYALLALDCKNYEIPVCESAEEQATRQKYVDFILSRQHTDGGFSLAADGESDVDLTAMALTALAKYRTDEKVAAAVGRALDYLSANQKVNGSFGNESSESCAQVLTALAAMNVNIRERLVQNGISVLDALLSFALENGGFSHLKNGDADLMATEQALYALCAYQRQQQGQNSLYDMTDVAAQEESVFNDIVNNRYRKEIEKLYQLGVVNGKKDNQFDPTAAVTRAEFAAMVVRALGLRSQPQICFADVPENHWSFAYVTAAYQNGIVTGVSEGIFFPDGLITREEAAVMLARSAQLYRETNSDVANDELLARFSDGEEISAWARSAMAFCVQNNILSSENNHVLPKTIANRDELAAMVYNLMVFAGVEGI